MTNLMEIILEDLKNAMRAKEEMRLSVLRMLVASLKYKKISLGKEVDLKDVDVVAVVQGEIKKRKDSVASYLGGDRKDLAEKEEKEIEILKKYLPKQASEEEIEAIVRSIISDIDEVSMKEFGRVMGHAMNALKGKADGEIVSTIVKKLLS